MNALTIGWIDQQLGKITMYRLVLYGLLALVGMALLLMLTGNIGFSPLNFIVSTVVITATAYGSNHLFAWLFGVKPHTESALITGLILALLFIPPVNLIGFVKLALVAAIAMASKYVIAVRNRHIFNPAAIAIVIASVSGLAYAGWWVATPAMIPITILAGGLILYRTQKQYVALVFVVVAAAMLFVQGTDPLTALTSWPLLFLGAFMLSEPLTLPPRHQQQFIVAGVVGVLATLPLHYGRITMTPALALVIGNFIGWWYGQRRAVKLRYVGKEQLGASTYQFLFDADKLSFEPGQYMELSLPHASADSRGTRRIFSIASRPGEEQVSIGTKMPSKPSTYKRALMNLKTGTTLYATRIAGDFVLPKDKNTPIICIAGGIGITPFVSFAAAADRKVTVIYSVNNISELSFVDVLKQHDIDVTVVSSDDKPLPDKEWKLVHGHLDENTLRKLIDVAQQPSVYASGPPAMVVNVRNSLKKLGVKKIKVDEFSGY